MSLAVVGIGEKLLIIDDDKVQPYVSFFCVLTYYIKLHLQDYNNSA